MSDSSCFRLYKPPSHTLETLRSVISGSNTREEIAEDLGVTAKTANNKIHDSLHLGLIKRVDGKFKATDEARRLIQLQDDSILEDRFVNLPGVEEVLDSIEEGGITPEEIGRIISFETESGAANTETFEQYGRVYARWIHHLGLGEVEDTKSESQHPLKNSRGANNPRVPPQRVIDALRVIDNVDNRESLANRMDYSETYTKKILTTAYALGVARIEPGGDFVTTEIGRNVTSASDGEQRKLLRNKLLEIPLIQAYCNRVSDGDFKNLEVMEQVSNDYSLGWSEGTVRTRAKRLYQWLLFTELAIEKEPGILEAMNKMPRGNLPNP